MIIAPRLRAFLCLSTLLLSGGCAAKHIESALVADSTLHAVWPSPPDTPRITLLRVVSGPEDIIPPSTAMQRFFSYVTGESGSGIPFVSPAGIAASGDGDVFVADTSAKGIHKFDLVKREAYFFSSVGQESFASPVAVALDNSGVLYVVDSVASKVYKLRSNGDFIGELAKDEHRFQRPTGIAVTDSGFKYVVDALAQKVLVFDSSDHLLRSFPHGADKEQLIRPTNITVDRDGLVYVTDAFDFSIKVFNSEGMFQRRIGEVGDAPGFFARPKGIATDSERHLYVVDANFDNFQIFDPDGRVLLYVGKTGSGPGEFMIPSGIFIDKRDRVYVSDSYNRRIQIFQYLKGE